MWLLRRVLLLLVPILAWAVTEFFYVDKFGGVNTFFDSAKIEDYDAQFAVNVLTDKGYLEKRPGNIRLTQILSGFPVRYIEEFIASNGTKYLISNASTTVYAYATTLSSGSISITTMSANFEIDTAKAFNRIYVTNTFDYVFSWDATSVVTWPTFPRCKLIESAYERMFCANTTNDASSIRISSYGSTSDWTVPGIAPLPTDAPNLLYFHRNDGESILGMKSTPWGVFICKKRKSGIIKGTNNKTFEIRIVDPEIGCISDRSIQMHEGILRWAALDGIYSWDGSGPIIKISQEIEPTYLNVRQLLSFDGLKQFSLQSEFEAGQINKNGTVYNEFVTTNPAGSLINPTFGPFRDRDDTDFGSGTFDQTSSNSVTSSILAGTIGVSVDTEGFVNSGFEGMNIGNTITSISTSNWVGSGIWEAASSGTFQYGSIFAHFTNCVTSIPSTGGVFRLRSSFGSECDGPVVHFQTFPHSAYSLEQTHDFSINLSTYPLNMCIEVLPEGQVADLDSRLFTKEGKFLRYRIRKSNTGCSANQVKTLFDMMENDQFFTSGTFTSRSIDTLVSTPTWGPMLPDVTYSTRGVVTFRTEVSSDNSNWVNLTIISSGSKANSDERRYIRYRTTFTVTDTTVGSPLLTEWLTHATSTGTYTSSCIFLSSSVTTWKQVDFSGTFDPETIANFSVRSSSWCMPTSDENVGFVAQTNHQVVAVATNSYIQFRTSSTIDSTTNTWQLDQAQFQWNDGVDKPIASAVKEGRYFLSVATQTNAANNDLVFVFQKHKKWMFFNGPSYYSLGLYDNNIIAGDSSNNSYAWKIMQSGTYNDDGEAIQSSWISKDFILGLPNNNKSLQEIWAEASYMSGSSVTVSYSVNRSDSYTDKTLNLAATQNYINRRIPISAGYASGKYIRIKLSNLELDRYFRLNAFSLVYEAQPLRAND